VQSVTRWKCRCCMVPARLQAQQAGHASGTRLHFQPPRFAFRAACLQPTSIQYSTNLVRNWFDVDKDRTLQPQPWRRHTRSHHTNAMPYHNQIPPQCVSQSRPRSPSDYFGLRNLMHNCRRNLVLDEPRWARNHHGNSWSLHQPQTWSCLPESALPAMRLFPSNASAQLASLPTIR
jgi:hypothetical protein